MSKRKQPFKKTAAFWTLPQVVESLLRRDARQHLEVCIGSKADGIGFGEVALLYAPAKLGKTTVCMQLVLAGYRQHRLVNSVPLRCDDAIYVYHEHEMSAARVLQYAKRVGMTQQEFSNTCVPARDLEEALSIICGAPRHLVVLDSLTQFLESSVADPENSSAEVKKFISKIKDAAQQSAASVLLIHHTNKSNTLRGSTAISGSVDHILRLAAASKDATSKRVHLKYEKGRCGLEGTLGEFDVADPLKSKSPVSIANQLEQVRTYFRSHGEVHVLASGQSGLTATLPTVLELFGVKPNTCAQWITRSHFQRHTVNAVEMLFMADAA